MENIIPNRYTGSIFMSTYAKYVLDSCSNWKMYVQAEQSTSSPTPTECMGLLDRIFGPTPGEYLCLPRENIWVCPGKIYGPTPGEKLKKTYLGGNLGVHRENIQARHARISGPTPEDYMGLPRENMWAFHGRISGPIPGEYLITPHTVYGPT